MDNVQAPPKLDYKKTLLIGFGFFGISIMWKLYNDYIPIFLQAGNPDFKITTAINGFGLDTFTATIIMALDNFAGLFLLPLIGYWSDRVWTRFGRRRPFILALAPISIIAFAILPFIMQANPTDPARAPLWLFIAVIALFILTMAGYRTPIISLMPDLTPSPLRSQANGIINLMGGVGAVIITLIGGRLYGINITFPFILASVLVGISVVILMFFVQEPRYLTEPGETREEEDRLNTLLNLRKSVQLIPPQTRTSLGFLLLSIFLWFVGYNAVETLFTSYGVNILQIKENEASMLSSVSFITFIAFSIPSGYIAARIGRRKSITIGLLVFAALLLAGFLFSNYYVIAAALAVGGCAWAMVNVNSLPMVIDSAENNATLGAYTGFYYIASQAAAIAGPILNGWMIKLTGNFNLVLLMPVIFFALAAGTMQLVTHGEARTAAK